MTEEDKIRGVRNALLKKAIGETKHGLAVGAVGGPGALALAVAMNWDGLPWWALACGIVSGALFWHAYFMCQVLASLYERKSYEEAQAKAGAAGPGDIGEGAGIRGCVKRCKHCRTEWFALSMRGDPERERQRCPECERFED